MTDLLDELRKRRAFECRITPDRALESFDEARMFLRERGLITRTADCALPSLYEACHEEPYQPGGRGFASWPATKWPWLAELADQPDAYALDIHRGKTVVLTAGVLALADPVCRAELTRLEADDSGSSLVLRHLAAGGPALAEDVERELGLARREFRAIRAELQRCGALVARQVVLPAATGDGHLHRSELARWDQAFPAASSGEPPDLVRLLGAGLQAAVLAPERDLSRWFTWRWLLPADPAGQLVERGLAIRPAPGWVATTA